MSLAAGRLSRIPRMVAAGLAASLLAFGTESHAQRTAGPAGTPRAMIERINGEVNRILQTPTMAERLAKIGLEPESMSPKAFAKVLVADRDRLLEIIQAAGISR